MVRQNLETNQNLNLKDSKILVYIYNLKKNPRRHESSIIYIY